MTCDLLNFKCIIINELIGNSLLAIILGTIAFFIFASKIRLGFETTITLGFIYVSLLTLAIGGIIPFFIISVVIIASYVAFYMNRIIGNR